MKPDFPLDWKPDKIGDKFVFTSKPSGLRLKDKDLVAFIPMELIPTHSLLARGFNLKKSSDIASGTYFEEGDLLVPKITPCFENGKQGIASGIPGGFGVASTEIIPIKAIPEQSNVEFLAYYLLDSEVRSALADKMEGTTGRQRLSKNVLQEWILPFPPLPEQRAIAAVLAKMQAAIETKRRIVATYKELKAATMAKLFREGTRGERLKQTEIGEIPDSWDVKRLEEVTSIERGKFTHRPRNDPRFYGGTIPFIQTGDITASNGRIRKYSQTLNERGLSVSRIFPAGTILITIAANIGDTGILMFDCAFPDSIIGMTPFDVILPEFLEYYLRTQREKMNWLAPKGTQKNINIEFLRPWSVPLPTVAEQKAILNALNAVSIKEEGAQKKMEVLIELFSSMLHLLMTGEVRVTSQMIEEARHVS